MKISYIWAGLLMLVCFNCSAENSHDIKLDALMRAASEHPILIAVSNEGKLEQVCEITRWRAHGASDCTSLDFVKVLNTQNKTKVWMSQSPYTNSKALKAKFKVEEFLATRFTNCKTKLSDTDLSVKWSILCSRKAVTNS